MSSNDDSTSAAEFGYPTAEEEDLDGRYHQGGGGSASEREARSGYGPGQLPLEQQLRQQQPSYPYPHPGQHHNLEPQNSAHDPRDGDMAAEEADEDDEEGEDPSSGISCICGSTFDDGFSIACDVCERWCHAACFDIVEGKVPEEWRCVHFFLFFESFVVIPSLGFFLDCLCLERSTGPFVLSCPLTALVLYHPSSSSHPRLFPIYIYIYN
jgi:hypothetical protein